jgi:hypothetical protein
MAGVQMVPSMRIARKGLSDPGQAFTNRLIEQVQRSRSPSRVMTTRP